MRFFLWILFFAICLPYRLVYADEIITGTGGTVPAELYVQWGKAYQAITGVALRYDPTNSSVGIANIEANLVDFGASDKPLSDDELQINNLIQFPTVIIGIVPIINLPGLKSGQLILTGPLLADIFLGKITKWNDPAIIAQNPGLTLPDLYITVIHRSEGSGTTFIFTHYLSKMSETWKNKIGSNTTVNWPIGIGSKEGSHGMATSVNNTPGAIGYIEFSHAQKSTYTSMKNQAQKTVTPSLEAFKAAAKNANWHGKNFVENLINPPGENSWPINSVTMILMPTVSNNTTHTLAVLTFFDWALHSGNTIAEQFKFVPLPNEAVISIENVWKTQIKDIHGAPIWK